MRHISRKVLCLFDIYVCVEIRFIMNILFFIFVVGTVCYEGPFRPNNGEIQDRIRELREYDPMVGVLMILDPLDKQPCST